MRGWEIFPFLSNVFLRLLSKQGESCRHLHISVFRLGPNCVVAVVLNIQCVQYNCNNTTQFGPNQFGPR